MSRSSWIIAIFLAGALAAAVTGWRKAARLQAEIDSLQAQIQAVQDQSVASSEAASERARELESLRSESQELLRLRNEVSQSRTSAKEAEKLRTENQQLRLQNQQLQAGATASSSATPAIKDQFPRDSWGFSGYATPDAALVSAIAAMKEGNPKTYLESLSPEEQARMSKVWENKSEAEIAAKHQQDVSTITGLRILDRKTISPEELQMNVYIEGVGRLETVSMKLINNEWKFGGFIRDPKK